MTAYPFTPSDAEERIKESIKPVEFKFSDFGTGFMDENLPAIAIDYLMNHQDFPADENYNPKQDPQLRPYEDYYDLFMFSKSAAESTAIIDKITKQAEHNYASPWYHLGRITGAFLDPSTALLFTKAGQSAKIFVTAFTA